jgi:hypothetical protein
VLVKANAQFLLSAKEKIDTLLMQISALIAVLVPLFVRLGLRILLRNEPFIIKRGEKKLSSFYY